VSDYTYADLCAQLEAIICDRRMPPTLALTLKAWFNRWREWNET
jgi:hypothetical protein